MMHLATVCCLLVMAAGQPDDEEPEINFRDQGFVQDVEHMKHHLENRIKFDPDKMSSKEMDFNFFKMHDLDDDNRLDGIELMAALRHAYDHKDMMGRRGQLLNEEDRNIHMSKFYIRNVDRMLEQDDTNNDGYLDYAEFSVARRSSKVLERASEHAKRQDDKDFYY